MFYSHVTSKFSLKNSTQKNSKFTLQPKIPLKNARYRLRSVQHKHYIPCQKITPQNHPFLPKSIPKSSTNTFNHYIRPNYVKIHSISQKKSIHPIAHFFHNSFPQTFILTTFPQYHRGYKNISHTEVPK